MISDFLTRFEVNRLVISDKSVDFNDMISDLLTRLRELPDKEKLF